MASLRDRAHRPAGRTQMTPHRPRAGRRPVDVLDLLDRHASRATDSPALAVRYVTLQLTLAVSLAIFLVGCGAAVRLAGLPLWLVTGIGVLGSGTAAATGTLATRLRRVPPDAETRDDAKHEHGYDEDGRRGRTAATAGDRLGHQPADEQGQTRRTHTHRYRPDIHGE